MTILVLVLCVLNIGLCIYAFYKDHQYRKEKYMNDLAAPVMRAHLINSALRQKLADSRGISREEFEKSWGK